ncbi:hypothetical protein BC831DRAFT_58074 [Entophlyctis helioformis]|nr:hypothetical protein BC831DRAFT_58074 [Entophlyctis helioformis]
MSQAHGWPHTWSTPAPSLAAFNGLQSQSCVETDSPVPSHCHNGHNADTALPCSAFQLANSYFLLLIIMQAIPIFTVSLTAWLPALPLIVIVGVTAIKDGVEDYRRQLADNQLNKARVHVIASSSNTNFPHSPHPKPASALAPGAFPAKKLANVSTGASTASLGALSKTSLDAVSPSFADSPSGKASFDVMREGWVHTTWSELRVGDFVLLKQNESVPADILVVASSNPDGIVYIETKNLDGETNLKAREAIPDTMHVRNAQDCLDLHAVIESEPPSLNLHTYSGAFLRLDSGVNTSHDSHGQHHHPAKQPYNSVGTLDKLGDLKVPLSAAVAPSDCASSDQQPTATPINIQNVMLRGCIVRNVDYVVGIVLFTGADTKIILNGGATPSKRSNIEERMNVQVACNFAILLSFCIIITVYESRFSFGWAESQMVHLVLGGTSASLVIFGASIIMLQNIVPISLYVTLELVKTIQAYFIYQDIDMYDHVTKETCIPKSWTITDDLGQIEYIFSDKTGTLTQNKMEFRRCSVRGQVYGQGFTDVSIDQSGLNAAERDALTESRVQTMLSQMALVYSNPVISPVLSFIDDRLFQDLHPTTAPDPLLRGSLLQFFMHLAICHTVPTPKRHRVEKLVYAAQSPDEGALVTGAKNAGFVFERREMNRMVVNVLGKRMAVEVLNVLEFNSARKRMSVIVRRDSGDILLMTKGADSVIYKRLAPGQDDLKAVTLGHLAEFATEGLRTLCLAQRVIPLEEYTEWVALYNKAALSLDNRDERLDEAAELIEHSLELVGASAIEDKLQEGVPQTIATLQHAGIKIWVLTGDKMETAINIGHAANLLWQDMTLLVVSGSGRVEVVEQLYRALAQFGLHVGKNASELPSNSTRELYHTESWPSWFLTRLGIRKRGNSSRNGNGDSSNKVSNSDLPHATGRRHNSLFPANRSAQRARRNQHERLVETLNGQGANESLARGYGLIIDGDALEHVFENLATQERLLELGMLCKSVICCRVSPKQKAQVVQLVQRGLGAMCLSIGDGANDVSMIQAAQIGIGISGKEGLQAAMASDFVIGQFRFLSKLMLVHGHWSYYRIAEGILTFFYKNMTWVFAMVWYQFFSGFTALILYDYNYILLFNLIFTSLPPLIIGVLDQDLSQQQILAFPQSYRIGITRSIFSFSRFWSYVADAVYQSAVCYYIAHTLFSETVDASGHPADHIVLGTATAMFAIVTINLTIAMAVKSWTLLTTTAMFLSGISFVIYVPTWAAIGGGKSRGIGEVLFRDPRLYLGLLLSVVVCMLPRVVLTYSRVMFVPTDLDILREIKVAESSQSEYSQVSVDDEDEDEDEPEPSPSPSPFPWMAIVKPMLPRLQATVTWPIHQRALCKLTDLAAWQQQQFQRRSLGSRHHFAFAWIKAMLTALSLAQLVLQ